MSMTCPVIKCFKSREPAYRSSSILIPHFLSCFFFSFCLLSSSSSASVFSGGSHLYLLPQPAFPTGGLYFKNKKWVKEKACDNSQQLYHRF